MSTKQQKVSERELKALRVLADFYGEDGGCIYFRTIIAKTGMNLMQVRRSVRALARKGLAKYERGLFDDDGMVAGSGYCCTRAGAEFVDNLSAEASPNASKSQQQITDDGSQPSQTGFVQS